VLATERLLLPTVVGRSMSDGTLLEATERRRGRVVFIGRTVTVHRGGGRRCRGAR
jgi:hypothetical protein